MQRNETFRKITLIYRKSFNILTVLNCTILITHLSKLVSLN
jgi:hypothetical protein